VDVLTTTQAARVAGIDECNARVLVPRLVAALDSAAPGVEDRELWSAGEVIAIAVVRALDPHGVHVERWADGATGVADAHGRGLCPAYLVTAGGAAFAILLDDDGADVAAARLLMRLAGSGRAARVVAVTPIVELLCDVLGLRASA
jgi:hypothetical protein